MPYKLSLRGLFRGCEGDNSQVHPRGFLKYESLVVHMSLPDPDRVGTCRYMMCLSTCTYIHVCS